MKRYFTMSLTSFVFSILNVMTYFLLGLITGNTALSGIFSITYPLQFVASMLLSFFSSASNIRANKEGNKNCVNTGMILGIIFGLLTFGIVAIFVDNYITFMQMDAKIYRTFTLMAIGQLFLGFVNNIIADKLYLENKDKKGNLCSIGFIILNLLTVTIAALITKNQIAILLTNLIILFIYVCVWFILNLSRFKFDFKVILNFKYESLNIVGSLFMLLIYLFGFRKAFSFGEEYYIAISFLNLITDPLWDALSVIDKIAKIKISQSNYNYKKALKNSTIITLFYIAIGIILYFSLFKVYNVILKIGLIYLSIEVADFIVNIFKSNIQAYLQLEYSPTKTTTITLISKGLRTILSTFLATPFNTNIAQISCGLLGLVLFMIIRYKNYKINVDGFLVRKTNDKYLPLLKDKSHKRLKISFNKQFDKSFK